MLQRVPFDYTSFPLFPSCFLIPYPIRLPAASIERRPFVRPDLSMFSFAARVLVGCVLCSPCSPVISLFCFSASRPVPMFRSVASTHPTLPLSSFLFPSLQNSVADTLQVAVRLWLDLFSPWNRICLPPPHVCKFTSPTVYTLRPIVFCFTFFFSLFAANASFASQSLRSVTYNSCSMCTIRPID